MNKFLFISAFLLSGAAQAQSLSQITANPAGANVSVFQAAPQTPVAAIPGSPAAEQMPDINLPDKSEAGKPAPNVPVAVPMGEVKTNETPQDVPAAKKASSSPVRSSTNFPKPATGQVISGTAMVLSPDTIEIGGWAVVLHGIDAPEAGQVCFNGNGMAWRCAEKAQEMLASLAAGKVSCRLQTLYGERASSAVCSSTEAADIGAVMVSSGLAVMVPGIESSYANLQDKARSVRGGIWAGTFDMPWTVRATSAGKRPG